MKTSTEDEYSEAHEAIFAEFQRLLSPFNNSREISGIGLTEAFSKARNNYLKSMCQKIEEANQMTLEQFSTILGPIYRDMKP